MDHLKALLLTRYKKGMNEAINEVLYGPTPTSVEFASSLTTSKMGICCLLIPQVLQEQSQLVLLLSMASRLLPLFKGVILQDIPQNNRSLLWRHIRPHH